MLYAWFHYSLDGITVATLGIQFYLLWLILFKTPKRMASFRYSLLMLMQNEIFLTLVICIGLNPDLLVESGLQGAIINGITKFLGPDGGRYGFAMALFFGASVFSNQIYCLIFRYTAIQQNYQNLHKKFNNLNVRFCFAILLYILPIICAYLAFYSMADFEEKKYLLKNPFFANPNEESAEILSKNETVYIILSQRNGAKYFGIFVIGGYSSLSAISIFFSVKIYRTISRNAAHFTAKTYRLHLQLTALLIIQFCLPALFLFFPVAFAIAACIFMISIIHIISQPLVLLLALFTLANSLCILLFIAPYRDYTFRWLGLKKIPQEFKSPALKTTKVECHLSPNRIAPREDDLPQIIIQKTEPNTLN